MHVQYQTIILDVLNHVATVELNRPCVHNAINILMIQELTRAFAQFTSSHTVRVIVLRGQGQTFCAGADIRWLSAGRENSLDQNIQESKLLAGLFWTINTCSKPVIAVVQGAVRGGGLGLMAVADVVLAQRQAHFALTETRLGLVPACILPFVTEKIGHSAVRAFMLSSKRFDSETAQKLGLVHEIFLDEADCQERLQQWCADFLKSGPKALSEAKTLCQELTSFNSAPSEKAILESMALKLAEIRSSAEAKEGLLAFLEKRPPAWIPKNC
jgi:methylglutaconyl-CoA hydratase